MEFIIYESTTPEREVCHGVVDILFGHFYLYVLCICMFLCECVSCALSFSVVFFLTLFLFPVCFLGKGGEDLVGVGRKK